MQASLNRPEDSLDEALAQLPSSILLGPKGHYPAFKDHHTPPKPSDPFEDILSHPSQAQCASPNDDGTRRPNRRSRSVSRHRSLSRDTGRFSPSRAELSLNDSQ